MLQEGPPAILGIPAEPRATTTLWPPMSRRVLLVGRDRSLMTHYADILGGAGYLTFETPDDPIETFTNFLPHAIVVITNDRQVLASEIAAPAEETLGWRTPILLVTERWREAETLLAAGEIDAWILPSDAQVVLNEVRGLLRQAAFAQEVGRRKVAADMLGVALRDRPATASKRPPRKAPLLYYGQPSLAYQALEAVASKSGREILATFSGTAALDYLALQDVAAAIIDLSDEPDRARSFAHMLRAGRANAHVPLIVCATEIEREKALEILRMGLTDILLLPAKPDFLRARIEALRTMSGRALAWSALYSQKRAQKLKGPSGAFTSDYLAAHLEVLGEDSALLRQPASALMVEAPAETVSETDLPRVMADLASIIGAIVRVEDLVAEASSRELAVVLPSATEATAGTAEWRVGAVLKGTRFGGPQTDTSPLRIARIEIAPRDTPAEILGRLRASLRPL